MALRYDYNDKHASYKHLLERIRLPSMESRRIQDLLLTIHNSIWNKAPQSIRNFINLRSFKYNLRRQEDVLSLPKVKTTKYGLKSWRYFAAKKWNELSNDIRIKVGANEIKFPSDNNANRDISCRESDQSQKFQFQRELKKINQG